MTPGAPTTLTFLPWAREGIASQATPGSAADVALELNGAAVGPVPVRTLGPGDVTGIAPSEFVRTDPPAHVGDFAPTDLASVELAHPGLPWMFSPAQPTATTDRLAPWLCLVVVARQEGVKLVAGHPLPVLRIEPPAAWERELPDLAEAWAWAHVQIVGAAAATDVAGAVRAGPPVAVARLVCPRRLAAHVEYIACVVPTTRAGVVAGLGGAPADADAQRPAWPPEPADDTLRLPVYHSWTFAAGPAGDFEALVRALRPVPAPATVGLRSVDIGRPGGGLSPVPGAILPLGGALRAPRGEDADPWPAERRAAVAAELERALDAEATPTAVVPPTYGAHAAGRADLTGPDPAPVWLRELNLDPRLRIAAGAGTQVVQVLQEELAAEAWEQLGEAREANPRLARAQLGREVGRRLLTRHLAAMSPGRLLAATAPAHPRLRVARRTLTGVLHDSAVPDNTLSVPFRRLSAARGAVLRRARPAAAGHRSTALAGLGASGPVGAMHPRPGMGTTALPRIRPSGGFGSPFAPIGLRTSVLAALAPTVTVLDRVRSRIDAPAHVWSRPDPLDPIRAAPEFPEAMARVLGALAPELVLPGADGIEHDSVCLLEADGAMIAAYLVGLNHELGRELLWRGFPIDLTATAFRRFWDAAGSTQEPDIRPIAEWPDEPLARQLRSSIGSAPLVLVLRGELLRRFPGAPITVAPAIADAHGDLVPDDGARQAPAFRGRHGADVAFVGFPLTAADAVGPPGWFVTFEELPGHPRFGFDEHTAANGDLAWDRLSVSASGHVRVGAAPTGAAVDGWDADAARMALLALQRPFRLDVHASVLLAEGAGGGA